MAALSAQFAMTKVLGHAATAGSARERLIQDFLVSHLPEMTSVSSGVIVDANGNRSKQQDIVLMLKSMPRLRFANGHDLIFQEGPVATFEIKTSVTSQSTISCIGANIRSVRALSSSSLEFTRLGQLSWPATRILAAVLTYEGTSLPSIASWLERLPDTDKPDVYLDFTKGILFRNDGSIVPTDSAAGSYLSVAGAAIGVARFLTILADVTGAVQFRGVNWDQYIG